MALSLNLSVDLGGQSTIRTLTLNPISPQAGEGYQAIADVFCLQEGSLVRFSIIGTDGYSDSETFNISANQTDGTFYLDVPGAATPGIQDTDTIEITLPDGTVISQKATLVFQ